MAKWQGWFQSLAAADTGETPPAASSSGAGELGLEERTPVSKKKEGRQHVEDGEKCKIQSDAGENTVL